MFSKVLIANRGEIACRVIRACRKLGVKTVAVYSEADEDSLHVKMADQAFLLGAPAPRESYLNIPRIIGVAQMSGAEAIHPGYGFLSENPVFARTCQEADLRFIGPYPYVLENMGDKVRARNLAKKAGVPILPGTDEPVEDSEAPGIAAELGFPMMVKAASGGGGIGIRVIHSPDDLKSVIDQQRSLASNAFGSGHLYFEKYMPNSSHIEVQVMGDEHGNVVHLFARDCSVQRRNQKLVEEGPPTKLSPEQMSNLLEYALRLARHIGYTNAGTVEFLASPEGEVYFLEMNTRLQVEHGVTEMITGVDLVELQLRVASGEPLPIKQEDLHDNGHAIEVRIYPEDPDTFIPAAGVIHDVTEPSGEHIRVDSALFPGYEVTTYYEPLMAKLMCWGETREEARKRMLGALDMYRLEGLKSNIPALKAALSHPLFVEGTYDTSLVSIMATEARKAAAMPASDMADKEMAAAIGVSLLLATNSHTAYGNGYQGNGTSPWKLYGLREQMVSRNLGSRSWR